MGWGRVLTAFRCQSYDRCRIELGITDGVFMLLQVIRVIYGVEHEMPPAAVADQGHGEGIAFGLGEAEIVRDPRIARGAVARVPALRDAVLEVLFLEQDDEFL